MIAAIALIAVAVAYRLLPVLLGLHVQQPEWLPNFSPMAAICLCGAAFLPKRLAIAVPFVALLGTDLVLNCHYGVPLFSVEFVGKTIAFAAVAALGWKIRGNARLSAVLPSVIGSSLLFYVATNTASWMHEAAYAKTFAGWVQALTSGLPGYPPTWAFLRNSLVSDLLFTGLFLACMKWSGQRATEAAPQPATAAR